MKNFYKNIFLTITCLFGMSVFVACDDVKEGDRYIHGGEIRAERTVLLEDFTGQNCVNCPEAHKVIEQLEEQYGDNLIAVSIHCGDFGISVQRTNFDRGRIGLMTEEGNAIMEAYGIQTFPMGVVDNGSPLTNDLWAGAIRNTIQIPTDINLSARAEYVPDPSDQEDEFHGMINISAEVLSGTARNANLQFWIIESGIVAEQRTMTTTIPEYVHNNVFRAQVFDGINGMNINLTDGFKSAYEGSIQVRWTNKEHWNIRNLAVVAFVSDANGVLQAVKTPLIVSDDSKQNEE